MTFVIPQYDLVINSEEGTILDLIVENPVALSMITRDIWIQSNSGDGCIIFNDGTKALSISKSVEVIWNPFSVDINDKKILSKLYSEICEISNESMSEAIGLINQEVITYLDDICRHIQYPLDYKFELDLAGLLKLYKVEIQNEEEGVISNIINYLKCIHQICHIDIFVFINLKMYLTEDEIIGLYKFVNYEKLYLINISGFFNNIQFDNEKYVIIDKDLCVIGP